MAIGAASATGGTLGRRTTTSNRRRGRTKTCAMSGGNPMVHTSLLNFELRRVSGSTTVDVTRGVRRNRPRGRPSAGVVGPRYAPRVSTGAELLGIAGIDPRHQ